MSNGLVITGEPACPFGRARPLANVFSFAKRKVECSGNRADIAVMQVIPDMPPIAESRFAIGEVVRHRIFEFRGVIFDIDPVFANSEEWYNSIPEHVRPIKEQPCYHLFAENGPVNHPAVEGYFEEWQDERYPLKRNMRQ